MLALLSGGNSVGASDLERRLDLLDTELTLVRSQVGSSPISVGEEFFGSQEALLLWLEEFLPSNKFEYFLDALSLLEIVTDNNKAFEDVMKMIELTHKGKWSSTTVAKYVASILLEIPTILGSSKCYDEDSPLPGIKTYESFNPSTLDGGVKGRIRKKLTAHGDGFRNTVGQMFYGSKNQRVKNLVLTMRAEAVDF